MFQMKFADFRLMLNASFVLRDGWRQRGKNLCHRVDDLSFPAYSVEKLGPVAVLIISRD